MKKSKIFFIFIVFLFLGTHLFFNKDVFAVNEENADDEFVKSKVEEIFKIRNEALLNGDEKSLGEIYNLDTKYGTWAYEHEIRKLKYIKNWSEKQGVRFISIDPQVRIRKIKGNNGTYSINLFCTTEYRYVYQNQNPIKEGLDKVNRFRIGTSHSLKLENNNENWYITREWYTDPFADSLNLDNIKADDIKEYILSQPARDISNLNERRISALEYADRYCGTASEDIYGYKYNSKYRNFNPMGGDCANFASQILHEGGGFKKNRAWNYAAGTGTKAWLNAHGFKDYMLNSGRASVIAYGNYSKVYKASYKLLPGDFVAYEKNGKVTHISVVSGADSRGYALVNCHNTDRYRVPWDLGWSDKKIKFWLVRVHF